MIKMIKINPFNKTNKEIIIEIIDEIFDKYDIDLININTIFEIYNEDEDIIEKITIEDIINMLILDNNKGIIDNDEILKHILNISNIFYNYNIIEYYFTYCCYEVLNKHYINYDFYDLINKHNINKEIQNIKNIINNIINNKEIKKEIKKQIIIKAVKKC